jgi:uncharacterized membrane protein YbhN (UPF0104 family)
VTESPRVRAPLGPSGADSGTRAPSSATTLVIEEGVFRSRLRRPRDIVAAILALVVALLVVLVGLAAQQTTLALDEDLAKVQLSFPALLWGLVSILAGLGVLLLPLAAAIGMLVRRRGRQLLEAFAAMTLATIVLSTVSVLVRDHGTANLILSLTGLPPDSATPGYPANPLLGGLAAFATTARLFNRPRWSGAAVLIITSSALVNTVVSSSTVVAQVMSVLVGLAVGLLVRYALGTPTTRPSGTAVAEALIEGGLPLVILRARGGTDSGRHYLAVTSSGEQLDVVVLDRDLEGSNLVATAWRTIRLRGPDPVATLSMRSQVERASMMSYAAEVASVPAPRLRVAALVSSDSALLAYASLPGRVVPPVPAPQGRRSTTPTLPGAGEASAVTPRGPTDGELEAAWRAVAALQRRFLAHQDLRTDTVRYDGESAHLVGLETGTVAAGDVILRLDVAEMLVTQALQTDAPRAVAAARKVLGDEKVLRALPVLQRVAMPGPTRAALRAHRGLLNDLRTELLTINPEVGEQPSIDLERLKPRTLVTMLLGTVAAYLLLSQLAQVNLVQILSEADWRWAGVAVGLSAITYVGAAFSLRGFVPDRLSFWRTFQAQLAASFATLVSPPTLGAVTVNARFLNRKGLPPAAAAATVGVSQVAAFVVHATLLLALGLAAGTQADLSFNPPRGVVIGIGIAAMLVGGLASISHVRRWLSSRLRPISQQIVPRLLTIAQRPAKLVEGFGGILLLNLTYCLCLVASVRAFSDSLTVAAISFVYLAGSTVGQAAPTPGGLGVVEAALAAGLTAAGMNSALAVSAVLLFRAMTFWLPTIPGWFCFRDLTRRNLL